LEPNRNSLQKPIESRSVLSVFRVNSMQKSISCLCAIWFFSA
jgi:hypothetical protein